MAIITIEGQGFYTTFPAGFIQGRINGDANEYIPALSIR
jgi:hypothetical protein